MKKLGTILAVAATALVGGGSLAVAQGDYPPDGASMALNPSTVSPGGGFTALFIGCRLGETVEFTFEGTTVSTQCNGPAGAMRVAAATAPSTSATFTAPTEPGTYTVSAVGLTSGETASATLTVAAAAAPAPAPSGGLPTTGSDSTPIAKVAVGLVTVGVGLAVVAGLRRRKAVAA